MILMEQLASKLPAGIGYDWTGMSYQNVYPVIRRPLYMPFRLSLSFVSCGAL
jgi:multidrug efflux pump